MNCDSEIPKYRKKKKSSISKSKEKSRHGHEYVNCILLEKDKNPYKATYCKICGKVGDVKLFESRETDYGTHFILNAEEIFERYKGLPIIKVKDIFLKYVSIDTNNK